LVSHAKTLAEKQQKTIIEAAVSDMKAAMGIEQARMQRLAEVNKAIRPEELMHLNEGQAILSEALSSGQLILDAVRVAIVTES